MKLRYILGLMVAMLAWGSPGAGAAEVTNRIVAFVNDDIITEGDVVSQAEAFLSHQERPAQLTDEQSKQLWLMMLRRLIEERLMVQEAKKLGLSVTTDEVRERLEMIKAKLTSPEDFAAMLQETGLNEEQLRNKVREQLLAQKAIDQQVREKIVITQQEVMAAIAKGAGPSGSGVGEQIHAYHLLIRVNESRPEDAAVALAAQVHDRLAKGEDPSELAKQYSEDPLAKDGGLMDWVGQGQLLPELDKALFALQPGQASDPIRTPLGYHLFKVVERKTAAAPDTTQLRRAAERRLYEEKFAHGLDVWLGELKQRAYVRLVNER